MSRIFKRVWIPLVVVMVLTLCGLGVGRLRLVFGSDNQITRPGSGLAGDAAPFDPKRVTYEIFGQVGALATINYLDLNAQPQQVNHSAMPWSVTLTTTAPSASTYLVAQGDGDSIGCRITINGIVKGENISHGVNAGTFCLVKSA